MKHAIDVVGVLTTVLVVSGCGSPAETGNEEHAAIGTVTAALGDRVTTTAQTGAVCSESQAFALLANVTRPSSVAPGESFPFSVDFRLAVPQLAFGLTFVGSATLAATAAAPAAPVVSLASIHFDDNQVVSEFGSGAGTLTAASAVGAPVVVRLDKFDYTITPDNPTNPHVDAHCAPPETFSNLLFTVPIVRVPLSKDDCKNGGYAKRTDATGTSFKNQGACIRYVDEAG
jgi:hypothetical protein